MGIYRTRMDRILADRSRIRSLVLQTREVVASSKSLLSKPVANTFLGRSSQAPSPGEQDAGPSSPRRKLPQ
ncbi:MAG TPA: hypothetical protein VMM15_07520 [Bradyrhizobium sp.]|nr:hypothetical protein [Bradyrhizobium sp.]